MDHDLKHVGRTAGRGSWTRCGVVGCGIGSRAGPGGRSGSRGFMRRRRCRAEGCQGLCSEDTTREDRVRAWTHTHGRRRRMRQASPGGAHLTSVRGKCRRGDGGRRQDAPRAARASCVGNGSGEEGGVVGPMWPWLGMPSTRRRKPERAGLASNVYGPIAAWRWTYQPHPRDLPLPGIIKPVFGPDCL